MKRYKVTFGNRSEYLSDKELQNFINVAVIHNRDINNFAVERLTPELYADDLVTTYCFNYPRFVKLAENLESFNYKFFNEVLWNLRTDSLILEEIYKIV